MPIIGHSLNKINIERKANLTKEDKIQNNIKIASIEAGQIKLENEEREVLNINFEFTVDYGKAGNLELKGYVIFQDSGKNIKEILEKWKKEEKFPDLFGTQIYNFIIMKANVKAIQLEDDVGLPSHIVFPRVELKQKQD